MADAAFIVKVDGRTFVVDRINLGDWRILKTHFGLNASDIITTIVTAEGPADVLNVDDPNVLVGLLTIALHHDRPQAPVPVLIAEVEALGMEGLEFPEPEADEDPTKAGADDAAATGDPEKSSKSGKTRDKPGTRR